MVYSANPFITCTANERQLITQTFSAVTDAGGAASSQTFGVIAGRGNVKRIQVVALSQTLADLNSRRFTVAINGVQVIINESFTKFSTFFQNITREYRVDWPEQSQVTVSITGGSPVAQSLDLVLFFVD